MNSEFSNETILIAALGNTWAHAVNTRMMVRFKDQQIREVKVELNGSEMFKFLSTIFQ